VKQTNRRWLLLILTISVLVRVGIASYLGDVVDAPPLLTDQRSYHALAVRLLEGHGYSFDENWYPFTPADTPTAHWSFLYPLFVAAVYAVFGAHPLAARVVQAVLGGLLIPWMVYQLARTIELTPSNALIQSEAERHEENHNSSVIPLVAAAIAAIYGYFILNAATLMTETFYIVTLLWSLSEGLRLGQRLSNQRQVPVALVLRLGLSLGLAALLRQSILPWVPVLFLYLLWRAWQAGRFRQILPSLTLAGLIIMACILPWTYRNYRVYDQFLLLNSNTGYAMYSAQHPMHGTSFSEFEAAPLPDGMWGRSEPELDRDLMQRGIQFVLEEPGRYVLLSLSRLRAYFEFWPTPDTTLLHNLGRTGSFGLFLPFMLYGLYLSSRQQQTMIAPPGELSGRQTLDLGLLYLFIPFYTLLHVLTWAMVRYRLPVDAVLMPFAALAITEVCVRLYRKAVRRTSTRTERPVKAIKEVADPSSWYN